MLIGRFTVAEVRAEEHERARDEEPQAEQRQHRAERHGAAAVLAQDEKVQEKARGKDDARV